MVFEWFWKLKGELMGKSKVNVDNLLVLKNHSKEDWFDFYNMNEFFNEFYDWDSNTFDVTKFQSVLLDMLHEKERMNRGFAPEHDVQHYKERYKGIYELWEKHILGNYSQTDTHIRNYAYTNLEDKFIKLETEYSNFKASHENTVYNLENKIYEKNKEIERLQKLLLKQKPSAPTEIVKETPKDARPLIKRGSKIYNKFRLKVLKRDEVCQCCGSTQNLHVHHISSFKYYNDRGVEVESGITLCEDCHNKYHSVYGKGHKNNPANFAKFMREYASPMQVPLDYTTGENIFEQILGGK